MRLFVYGTLLPKFPASRMIAPYVSAAREGRVRGRLVDVGSYPALIPACWEETKDGNACVLGLWVEITREGLAVADRYEEFYGIEERNDYERIRIADADRPEVSGWVYAWPDARGYPDAGIDWWPDKGN